MSVSSSGTPKRRADQGAGQAVRTLWPASREVANGRPSRCTLFLLGGPETDHRDHDGLNNQRSNLRPGRGVNQRNARPQLGGTSQYKGVCWYTPLRGQGRWKAQIRATGMSRHLGYFLSEVDAAHAYDTAARAAFGEYAVVNFPIESRYELLTLTHP